MKLSLQEGKQLIHLARATIEGEDFNIDSFKNKQGVFVTLLSFPSKQLRGCIGFPQPTYALGTSVKKAAKTAAFEDHRFPPVRKGEQFLIEISVLTVPELIKDKLNFEIGKHGLIVKHQNYYGLLLPQVFVEWNTSKEEALQMTCEKANFNLDGWKEDICKVYKFEAQLFIEETPAGEVIEKNVN